jgi:hypothetical protein
MLKRNFEVKVKNHEGRPHVRAVFKYDEESGMPLMDDKGNHSFSHHEPMTLRLYALNALSGRWKGDDNLSVADAHTRMKLHDRIAFAPDGVVELEGKDGQLILDCLIKQGCDPIVVGRMKDMLDTDPSAETPPVA